MQQIPFVLNEPHLEKDKDNFDRCVPLEIQLFP